MPATKKVSLATKLRKNAERLNIKIAHDQRPMTSASTRKRDEEYQQRLNRADDACDVRDLMLAMADQIDAGTLPPQLAGFSSYDALHVLVARLNVVATGSVRRSSEYAKKDPACRCAQELLAAYRNRSPEVAAELENQKRAAAIRLAEGELRRARIPGFFPTPNKLIDQMLALAAERLAGPLNRPRAKPLRILEPSAGIGSIVLKAREKWPDAEITAIEIHSQLCRIMDMKGIPSYCADFESIPLDGQVDLVLMNPPFEKGADCVHVMKAFERLAPGGVLVAIMRSMAGTSDRGVDGQFKMWAASMLDCRTVPIEAGAFTGPDSHVQTGVSCKFFVASRPLMPTPY